MKTKRSGFALLFYLWSILFILMLVAFKCSFFQAVVPQACEYADTICATANTLCALLDNPASTSGQIDSAKTAFLGQVQTVTAAASNKAMQLRKVGK